MSYRMPKSMGQLPASVDPARFWLIADDCWSTEPASIAGGCAIAETSPGFAAISERAARGQADRLDRWVASRCQSGHFVYVSEPYERNGDEMVDVYAASLPLDSSFQTEREPSLHPVDCAQAHVGAPSASADRELLAAACLEAADAAETVELPHSVVDPATGMRQRAVRYDPDTGECTFVRRDLHVGGAIATVIGAGIALVIGKQLIDGRRA